MEDECRGGTESHDIGILPRSLHSGPQEARASGRDDKR